MRPSYRRFRRLPAGYLPGTRQRSQFHVSILDKITGRAKKAAGDLAGDPSLRSEGRKEERKGEEKEKLAEAQERVEDKAKDVADLERRT
jgi:uncharacterized protein YjbJ (UPF0337 family)